MAVKNPPNPAPSDEFFQSEQVWKMRRTEPRIALQVPLILKGKDKLGNEFSEETVTENVSRQGACVETSHEMELGAVVQVSAFGEKFQSKARVAIVWSRRAQSGKYRVGLRFVDPTGNWIIQ